VESITSAAITTIVTGIISAVIGSVVSSLKLQRKAIRQQSEAAQAIHIGLKELLWAELKKTHADAVKQGGLTIEDRQHLENVYSAYHNGAHGNGTGTRLYQDAMNLPVIDMKKEL
jgi:hypothetical protein